MQISGSCDSDFREVQTLFADLWQGIEVGAALSVYWQGECVVDLWGGYTDRARTQPWREDTLVNVYSATKGVVATAIAKLVASEHIHYEDPVTRYWPEFAQNGKSEITVAQLLSHQAGLCGVTTKLNVSDLYDWEKMTGLLASQEPLWAPGSAAGYHAVTWGYLAGELIRRSSGIAVGEYIRKEIAEPLGLDFFLGMPDEEQHRCAELIGPNHITQNIEPIARVDRDPTDRNHLFDIAQLNPVISPFKHASSEAWRAAEIPASNGHSDARSLARMYGALASDTFDVSLTEALEVAVDHQQDLVMRHEIRRSQGGYILSHEQNYGGAREAFGHAGAGGSMAFADPKSNLGFAYVMNQLQPEGYPSRIRKILESIYHIVL